MNPIRCEIPCETPLDWIFPILVKPFLFLPEIVHLPVQFVTERNIIRGSKRTDKFVIQLCGGCLYDGNTASVSLNIQSAQWNPKESQRLEVAVSDQHNNLITKNVANGQFVEDFSFIYKAKYGDLVIESKTGKATTYTYTVTFQFSPNKRPPSAGVKCKPRWQMNNKEKQHTKQVISFTENGVQRGHILKRVFKKERNGTVLTERVKKFQINYCFPDKRQYHLTVSTIALDSSSGFATYVCTQRKKDCTIEASEFDDTSGGSVNFVPIKLSGDGDLGPITVLVGGDGRNSRKNTFTLAASNYRKKACKK